jgi:cell division protease FtsH
LPRDGANPWGDLTSPRTLELVDEEVRRTIESAYDDAMTLLTSERARLDTLAEALLERETLDQIDAYRVVGLGDPDPIPTN